METKKDDKMRIRGIESIVAAINNDPTIVREFRASVEIPEYLTHQSKLDSPTIEKHIRHSLIEEMVNKLEEEGLLNIVPEQSPESMSKRFTCSLFVVDLF